METETQENLGNLENKPTEGKWGGPRPNSGRPTGSENEETKKRRIAEREYKQRVILHLHDLFNSQLALAKGLSFMYRIEEDVNEHGRKFRKHVLVESPTEIKDVLDELDGDTSGTVRSGEDETYYYITTKAPDGRAIDSMFDRVFGKSKQSTVLEDPDGNALTFVVAEVIARKNTIDVDTNT